MDICIDFDGTCVTHEFPEVGRDIGAAPVLRKLVEKGHNLILFTMRSNDPENDRYVLDDAIEWFYDNGIGLYGVQEHPGQSDWTSSPKAYGQIYIDDAALGVPLIKQENARPFVDWNEVSIRLKNRGVL